MACCVVATLNLELPGEAVVSLGADDAERRQVLRLELALALYRDGKLPPGRAADLAGINRWDFTELAKSRGIPTPYTPEMIKEDFGDGDRHQ